MKELDHTRPWSAKEIQLALFSWLERRGRTLILPNFTPRMWHECDMFSITGALYFHEIEVKVSRSDFHADFNKDTKHAILSGENPRHYYNNLGPRTFSFACRAGLLSVDDMPEYAGLVTVDRCEASWENRWTGYHVEVVKKPPTLPAEKMTPAQVFKISNNLWWRFAREWKARAEETVAA